MSSDLRLRTLKPQYEQLFATCQLRRSCLEPTGRIAQEILQRQGDYGLVERQTGVPWWFVGILHYRELDFRDAHLHNGDSLTNRTIRYPQGRPIAPPANGQPYTFVESAIDALRWKQFHTAKDHSIGAMLWGFELWNNFCDVKGGKNSEYLWNGTNHFSSSQYWNQSLIGNNNDSYGQGHKIGAAAIVWYLYYQGMLNQRLQFATPQTSVNWQQASNTGSIQFLDLLRGYGKLPHQDAALAWLQQQQSPSVLTEFTRRWQDDADRKLVSVGKSAVVQLSNGTQLPTNFVLQQQSRKPESRGTMPKTGIRLRVLSDTVFKTSTQQSYQLKDSQKVFVKANTEFEITSDQPAENKHIQVVLANVALGTPPLKTWYVFCDHVEIEGSEPDNAPKDEQQSDLIKINSNKTGPIQLPGYDKTFYLSEPIITGGHFSWAEATKNGTRIPTNKTIVENILKIAEVMEEVREYFGNRPIVVNSWYRDPVTNRKVGGATRSRHLSGDAVDFVVEGISPMSVNKRLDSWWGSRGGLASASCFTHIDARGHRARWSYGF